jgi:two-component system, cell cycle response regulator DivK
MKKILIVDDDAKNIFALRLILKSRGFQCITAQSAEEAFKLLQAEDVSVILLDMMMPDMDGYQTLAILKDKQTTRSIPVVAVTAQAMTGDKEKCLEAGASAYISKPVDVNSLLTLLHKYIDKK